MLGTYRLQRPREILSNQFTKANSNANLKGKKLNNIFKI
jgi:hypothetical protein